jgi:hypothetical protein
MKDWLSLVVLYVILAAGIMMAGCKDREQHASNAIAGCDGSVMILCRALQSQDITVAHALIQAAIDVQKATIPRIENAVGVPRSELPAPQVPASDIDRDPGRYTSTTPTSPPPGGWGGGVWGGIATAGLMALWGIKKIAPLVPGLGTAVGGVAELAWGMMAHSDQKRADEIAATTANAAKTALPIIELIAMNRASLPREISDKVTPERLQALATLVAVLSDGEKAKP